MACARKNIHFNFPIDKISYNDTNQVKNTSTVHEHWSSPANEIKLREASPIVSGDICMAAWCHLAIIYAKRCFLQLIHQLTFHLVFNNCFHTDSETYQIHTNTSY